MIYKYTLYIKGILSPFGGGGRLRWGWIKYQLKLYPPPVLRTTSSKGGHKFLTNKRKNPRLDDGVWGKDYYSRIQLSI